MSDGSTGFSRLDFENGEEKARCCAGFNQGVVYNKENPCANPLMTFDEQECFCGGVGFAFYEANTNTVPRYVQIPGDCRYIGSDGFPASQQLSALMPFRMLTVTETIPPPCASNVTRTYYKFIDARGLVIGIHMPDETQGEGAPRFLNYYDSSENVNSASRFGTTQDETEEALCFGFPDDEKETETCKDDDGNIVCRCQFALQGTDVFCVGPSSFPCDNQQSYMEYVNKDGLYFVPPQELLNSSPMFCFVEEQPCTQ